MDDIKAKQQIVEKIKASTNILVTVSNDPSVDALSAAIGFTLLLDKLDKHATAIFSGTVPPAIAFLEPEKILDDTTDSLRDFIIALDKEKADHLRYKLDGDVVKIFITPYKTTITSDDLQFSQGDFNVELVIALGVDNQEHLDGALEAHGQILHDATVITVTAGDQVSKLGGLDWHDSQASSLSEMVAGLAEAMKTDKNATLLDKQSATAFLTGIVAETDRFSNTHTTARVMTIASQLMAGGADQQLIAAKLQETHEIGELAIKNDNESLTIPKSEPAKESLKISHQPGETLEELDKRVKAAEQAEAATAADKALHEHIDNSVAAGAYALDDSEMQSQPANEPTAPQPAAVEPEVKTSAEVASEPSMGGTLNATTEQAAEDAHREAENDQNKTILSHSYLASTPSYEAPMSATEGASSGSYVLGNDPAPAAAPTSTAAQGQGPTLPAPATPADFGLPMPPPVPDFPAPPTVTSAYAMDPSEVSQPERLGDILAPEPTPPAASTTPPASPAAPQDVPVSQSPNDPGQFKIPSQP